MKVLQQNKQHHFRVMACRFGLVIGLCLFLGFANGCRRHGPPMMPPVLVESAITVQKDMPVIVTGFGQMTTVTNVDIQPQISGKLLTCYFPEGIKVTNGAPLFLIDPSPFKASLDRAEAILAQDQATLRIDTDTLERNRKLYNQKLIAQLEFDKYVAQVDQDKAKIDQDKADIALAKINLGYCYINSPCDGITGKIAIDVGNIVDKSSVLVNIKQVDPIFVDFTTSENNLNNIRKAMANEQINVEISVRGNTNTVYKGFVTMIENSVDEKTGTISLRAVIPNPTGALWPGQFVDVSVVVTVDKGIPAVPDAAIQIGKMGPYLFVIDKDNKTELRPLVLGPHQGVMTGIKEGVKVGEKVVTAGLLRLYPGASVVEKTK